MSCAYLAYSLPLVCQLNMVLNVAGLPRRLWATPCPPFPGTSTRPWAAPLRPARTAPRCSLAHSPPRRGRQLLIPYEIARIGVSSLTAWELHLEGEPGWLSFRVHPPAHPRLFAHEASYIGVSSLTAWRLQLHSLHNTLHTGCKVLPESVRGEDQASRLWCNGPNALATDDCLGQHLLQPCMKLTSRQWVLDMLSTEGQRLFY